jgi:hypothetical protein
MPSGRRNVTTSRHDHPSAIKYTLPPLLLQSRYIQPSPSGHRGCPPPLTVPCPPLPRVDGAMDEARRWIAAPHPRHRSVQEMEVPRVGRQAWPGFDSTGKFIPPLLLLLLPPPKIMQMPRGELPAGRPRAAAAAARPTTV